MSTGSRARWSPRPRSEVGPTPVERGRRVRRRIVDRAAAASNMKGPEIPSALFITGRFRSGSTLVWNMFRQVPAVAAYYEPLHDRLLDWLEHPIAPQPTHFHVDTYFAAYPPRRDIAAYHRRWFAGSNLYLEAKDQEPVLEAYIRFLIEAAAPRLPVLKFNRVDFRLGWL